MTLLDDSTCVIPCFYLLIICVNFSHMVILLKYNTIQIDNMGDVINVKNATRVILAKQLQCIADRQTGDVNALILDADGVQPFLLRYKANVVDMTRCVSHLARLRLAARRRQDRFHVQRLRACLNHNRNVYHT